MSKKNAKIEKVEEVVKTEEVKSNITTTTNILKSELLKKSTFEDKAKNAFEICKKQGFTYNKQGKEITKEGLLRLCKTMYTVGVVKQKKGWWSEYEAKEEKDDIKFIVKKVKLQDIKSN